MALTAKRPTKAKPDIDQEQPTTATKRLSVDVPVSLFVDFKAKAARDNTTIKKKIIAFIEAETQR